MQMAVFDATGTTGRLLVRRALEVGHRVMVYARTRRALEVDDAG